MRCRDFLTRTQFTRDDNMSVAAARSVARSSRHGVRSLATHAPAPAKHYGSITPPYEHLIRQLGLARQILNRPLTVAEKIVYAHLDNVEEGLAGGDPVRGEKYLKLRPDRVAMQGEFSAKVCKVTSDGLTMILSCHRCLCANGLAAILYVRPPDNRRAHFNPLRPSHQRVLWRRG